MPGAELPTAIVYGRYFGECIGYCIEEITITSAETIYAKKPNPPNPEVPDLVYTTPTPPETWRDLTGAVDWPAVRALPELIGQPDAADQGGEFVASTIAGVDRRVDLERDASVPALDPLLARLRRLRADLAQQSGL